MMHLYKKSRFTVDIPVKSNGQKGFGLYHTMTGAFVLILENDWTNILNNSISAVDPAIPDMLNQHGFLVKDVVDETSVFENWKQQYVHDYGILKSKVLVTRKCNNRCRYCILDPEAQVMSSETAMRMDKFYIHMIKEKNPQNVKDDFLGGEPFLNYKVILESSARRFFFCQGKDIDYRFTVTTNGTLISEPLILQMKALGLAGIRVSMAGPAPVHDLLRPSARGEKTYEKIMGNLQDISGQVPITIECQYDAGSTDYTRISEMLDDFAARRILVENIIFSPILPRRGENPFNSGMGNPEIYLYLIREAERRGYPINDEAPSNACMADFRSVFVFDTDGSIIPCPSMQAAEMAYGHVDAGIDFVLETQVLKRNLADRCLNQCELLPVCLGGCRLQALINHNDFHGVDCHYDTYRILLENHIRTKAAVALSQKGLGGPGQTP